MGAENYADYLGAIHDPATVRAMLEDYRAGLGVDRAVDDADRAAGRRITCPTMVLWSTRDDMEQLYATSWPYGGPGPLTYAAARSTADITWPKRPQRTSAALSDFLSTPTG